MVVAYPQFRNRNVELVAISTDDIDDAAQMAAHAGAEFPVLADPDGTVVRQYGVYDLLGDGVAAPATFIVSKGGGIEERYVGEDIADRLSVEQTLQMLDRILN